MNPQVELGCEDVRFGEAAPLLVARRGIEGVISVCCGLETV